MRRGIITSLAVLAWGSVGLNFASAQFGGTLGQPPMRPRPTISPYLNIGGGAGAYYGIVKPQMEGNRAIYDLQQGGSRIQQDGWVRTQAEQNTSALGGLTTGHQASFFNTSHYYPTNPPGGATTASPASFGSGLGGYTPPSANFGINQGYGINQGFGSGGTRTFFGVNMGAPLGGR